MRDLEGEKATQAAELNNQRNKLVNIHNNKVAGLHKSIANNPDVYKTEYSWFGAVSKTVMVTDNSGKRREF